MWLLSLTFFKLKVMKHLYSFCKRSTLQTILAKVDKKCILPPRLVFDTYISCGNAYNAYFWMSRITKNRKHFGLIKNCFSTGFPWLQTWSFPHTCLISLRLLFAIIYFSFILNTCVVSISTSFFSFPHIRSYMYMQLRNHLPPKLLHFCAECKMLHFTNISLSSVSHYSSLKWTFYETVFHCGTQETKSPSNAVQVSEGVCFEFMEMIH